LKAMFPEPGDERIHYLGALYLSNLLFMVSRLGAGARLHFTGFFPVTGWGLQAR
jgi:hypothetical protein